MNARPRAMWLLFVASVLGACGGSSSNEADGGAEGGGDATSQDGAAGDAANDVATADGAGTDGAKSDDGAGGGDDGSTSDSGASDAASGDASDAGTHMFACGSQTQCTAPDEYCYHQNGPGPTEQWHCRSTPSQCAGSPTCACAEQYDGQCGVAETCSENNGEVTAHCSF